MTSISSRTFRIVLLLSFVLISVSSYAQNESVVYIGTNGKITDQKHALFTLKIRNKSSKTTVVQTFKLKNAEWERFHTEQYKKLNDSTYQIRANGTDFNGTIIRTFYKKSDQHYLFREIIKGNTVRSGEATSIVPLLLDGKVKEYYSGGNQKSVSEYRNNELVSNQNWLENGDKYIDNIFYSVDNDPTFEPGMKVLHQHILKGFKDAGIDISSISGSLIVGFVVMENGTVDGVRILKGLGPNINTVAYESLKSLKGDWKSAKLNNQTVRYFQVFPINFIYKQYQFEFAELRGAILHYGAY